jgi:hypothetical protein
MMLKKPVSGVLASLRGSTYRSVRLASSLAGALPTGFLSILRVRFLLIKNVSAIVVLICRNGSSPACSTYRTELEDWSPGAGTNGLTAFWSRPG